MTGWRVSGGEGGGKETSDMQQSFHRGRREPASPFAEAQLEKPATVADRVGVRSGACLFTYRAPNALSISFAIVTSGSHAGG